MRPEPVTPFRFDARRTSPVTDVLAHNHGSDLVPHNRGDAAADRTEVADRPRVIHHADGESPLVLHPRLCDGNTNSLAGPSRQESWSIVRQGWKGMYGYPRHAC